MSEPSQKLVTVTIDGRQITVAPGTIIIQAGERLGGEIPPYCYHPRAPPQGGGRGGRVGGGDRGVVSAKQSLGVPHRRKGGGVPAPGLPHAVRPRREPDRRGESPSGQAPPPRPSHHFRCRAVHPLHPVCAVLQGYRRDG